jgi:cell division protein FtsB
MKIPHWLRNKYVFTGIIFLAWLLLFHNVDVMYVWSMRSELKQMKQQCEEYEIKNAAAHEALHDLNHNMQSLEKFAREHYFMKKDNEDVFVVYEGGK